MRIYIDGGVIGVIALLLLASAPALAQDDAAATSPTEFVQTQASAVLEIINRDVQQGTEAFAQRQNDLKGAVRDFLDYRELVRRALGDHWEDRTAEQQDAFVELMTRLIETNYTVKMGEGTARGDYEVTYDDEMVRGQNARVMGTVTYDDEVVMVEVMLMQRDTGWIVWDLVTDDVSIQETYAESFDEIIYEDGWDELVRKIEERLEELEAELAEQTAGVGDASSPDPGEADPESSNGAETPEEDGAEAANE